MNGQYIPTWWKPLVSILIALAILLVCLLASGCAGTKYANASNTHELSQQQAAIQRQDWTETARRNERMQQLQQCRNETEGMVNVPPSDDLLPIAKEKLRAQASWRNLIWGAGSTLLGDHWGKLIALLVAVGTIGMEEYYRRRNKKLAVANTKAIEAFAGHNPEAGDQLKTYQRYYTAKDGPNDRLVQAAAAAARAEISEGRS